MSVSQPKPYWSGYVKFAVIASGTLVNPFRAFAMPQNKAHTADMEARKTRKAWSGATASTWQKHFVLANVPASSDAAR